MEPLVALVGRAVWQVEDAQGEVARAEAPAWEGDAARAYRGQRVELAIKVGEARTSLDLARGAVAELEQLAARAAFGTPAGLGPGAGWLR